MLIVKLHNPKNPDLTALVLWSTVADAPASFAATEDEIREYIKEEYGNVGLRELPARLDRVSKFGISSMIDTLDDLLETNRAGPNETQLDMQGLWDKYCRPRMECPTCYEPVFYADDNNEFQPDDRAVCLSCASICQVEEEADWDGTSDLYVRYIDAEDVGQPLCNGACSCDAERYCVINVDACPRGKDFGRLVQVEIRDEP